MYRSVVVVAVVSLLVGSVVLVPIAGADGVETVEEAEEPMVHVAVATNGDATVSLVSVHELTDEDERTAFESLEDDEDARHELRDRFGDRMERVADDVGDDGAESITDASIDVRTDDDRGIVTLSVTWEGLAAVEDEALVVTEPFASGFESDRPLVVAGPDGSTVVATAPEPAVEDDAHASWEPGTDLDGFEVVLSLEDGESGVADGSVGDGDVDDPSDGAVEGTTDELPGFGVVTAVVALIAGVGAMARSVRGTRSRSG